MGGSVYVGRQMSAPDEKWPPTPMQSCNDYLNDSQEESGFGNGGVNIYDIFADVCGPEREVDGVRQFARVLGRTEQAAVESGNDVAGAASLAAAVLLPTPGEPAFSLSSMPDIDCSELLQVPQTRVYTGRGWAFFDRADVQAASFHPQILIISRSCRGV